MYPYISVIIATLNSQLTLQDTLKSIKRQVYPKNKIEILIIDGGSKDETLKIARSYGCRILKNNRVDQVYAKYLGWLKARGEYILFLDSDESLVSKNSLKNKVLVIKNEKTVSAVLSSGYVKNYSRFKLDNYVNEFGDPFSYFMYRISKASLFFLNELKRSYLVKHENPQTVIFDFSGESKLPFIELTSMGVLLDRKFIDEELPQVKKEVSIHTHLFYLLNLHGRYFSIMKKDPVYHRPVSTLPSLLRKINSRVKNNIFRSDMGKAGFVGREKYQQSSYKIKKLVFVFYNLLVIPVVLDGLFMSITRREPVYLVHIFLSFYTLFSITFFYLLKFFRIRVNLVGYGT